MKKVTNSLIVDDNKRYHSSYEQERREAQQTFDLTKWLKRKGIDITTIDRHPQLNDVITLANIREDLYYRMNPSEQATWAAYWNLVYKREYPLTKKFWMKMERITKEIDQREHLQEQQKLKIQSLRQANTEPLKRDQDNEAKGSHSHSSHVWTVAYESATNCPYF